MSQTVSEFVWKRLSEWGLSRVYGYPGDGVGGLDVALEKAKDFMHYVQVRHEEMAAFMASAHAKFTGQPGLCYATSGPGAIHLLTGLYDAKADHVPVVAIVGQQARSALGSSYQQEVDLQTLFSDVTEYVMTATVPGQVRTLIDRAVRIAQTKRAVTCVIIPNDLQELAYADLPMVHGATHTGVGYPGESNLPNQAALQRAADILNEGGKIAMLVGAGCLSATDEVIAVAERLGAGVAKSLLGKAAVPDDLPYVTGSLGLLGTKPSWDMMQDCDTLFMVGSAFPYSEFLPKPGDARGVQIDIDGANLSLRYPMEYSLIGDSAATLRALLPLLKHKTDTGWRDTIEKGVASWWKTLEDRAMVAAEPINPQRVFWELSPLLPENCILTADSGSVANWYARDIKIRRGMKASLSGGLASLGAATPYAMAAKMAFPERTVIGFIGDGAMQMNGLNVMITVSKYWREWSNPHFIIMVLNNRDLNQVTWEERVQLGDGKTESTQSIPDFPYHKYAELIGLKGIFCDNPDKIGAAWQEALAADRPVILEMYTDPNVPPLPPHITLKDEELHDDDDRRAGARQRAEELGEAGSRRHPAAQELSPAEGISLANRHSNTVEPGASPGFRPLGCLEQSLCGHPAIAGASVDSGARRGSDGAGGPAAQPCRRNDCGLGAGRQCDGALPRGFHNSAMWTPIVSAALSVAVSVHGHTDRRTRAHRGRDLVYAAAGLTGVIGTGFHLYNITKKPGGFCWQNLFYSAPIGAPAALSLSGLMGFLSERVRANQPGTAPKVAGYSAGRAVAALTGASLLGTVGEAGLLHFRGAYHNPFMLLPVSVPPIAAALLANAAMGKSRLRRHFTRWWLRATAVMGVAGVAFHAYGVSRSMGGWRNWRQNAFNGPPLPAPPSFSGLALAGLAALGLLEDHPDD